uniref:Uncharacterized protein n=1 Tax=Onchocerca volvulus TaxID=6282 RepID=A0A8R1XMI8_ONCVO
MVTKLHEFSIWEPETYNLNFEEIDENKLRDLLYILCVRRPLLSTDLEYIKDKLSVLDEIHDLGNEIIEM